MTVTTETHSKGFPWRVCGEGEYTGGGTRGGRLYDRLEKNGDVVEMACYAPLFSHAKLNQWVPDMIFYSNDGIFGSANYYVQQMYGNHAGDYSLNTELAGAAEQTLYESAVDMDGDVVA